MGPDLTGGNNENRLTKVTKNDSGVITTSEYKYDPFGRRIEKKISDDDGTATTTYLYDSQNIIAEYDANGNPQNRYIQGLGIDEHLAVITGKNKNYYHADGLGSITALTDGNGKTVQTYQYDSFGNLKDQMNRVKQPYTFTGREWDKEAELYYYRARYYDAELGRFISKDPIGFNGGDVNLYSYVHNNPIISIDPTGETCYTYDSIPSDLRQYVPAAALAYIRDSCITLLGCRCCPGVELQIQNDYDYSGALVRRAIFIGFCGGCPW